MKSQRRLKSAQVQRSGGLRAAGRADRRRPSPFGKRSPLDAHKQWLLELIAAEADLTLEEIAPTARPSALP